MSSGESPLSPRYRCGAAPVIRIGTPSPHIKKYFLIRNLGYDGLMISRYSTLFEAEKAFKEALQEQEEWDEKYSDHPSDKGLVVIEGSIVRSDCESEIFGS